MTENIIAFAIFLLLSIIMILIGVFQIKSKRTVSFYTWESQPKKEQICDVEVWNKKHGTMWIVYGVSIISSFVLSSFIKSNEIYLIISIFVVIVGLIIMMLYHNYLKKKYYI